MSKENQRITLSKRLLKDGILQLLGQKNITDIRVCELCALAGINRSTFYRHYQTPHEVLLEIEMDFIRELHNQAVIPNDTSDYLEYATLLCRYIYDHRQTVKLFIRNNSDCDFLLLFQRYSEKFLQNQQVLYKGKPVDPAALRLMETFFSYGSYAMVKQWLMEELPLSPEDVAKTFLIPFGKDYTLL